MCDAVWSEAKARQALVRRQHLSQLLEGLALRTQHAASSSAPQCAASLLHLTQALADQHASLLPQAVPAHFVDLLAEAAKQGVGLCVSCVSHQVQAIKLRLATSDLFDEQAGTASGTISLIVSVHKLSSAIWSCHCTKAECKVDVQGLGCYVCGYCNNCTLKPVKFWLRPDSMMCPAPHIALRNVPMPASAPSSIPSRFCTLAAHGVL